MEVHTLTKSECPTFPFATDLQKKSTGAYSLRYTLSLQTIPTAAKIIKHAHERGAKTIGTAGIFGYGNENIEIKDISEYDDTNPAIEELRKQGITENHLVLTTNKLIRDNEPVTPYTLDEVAKIITMNALKLLDDRI